MSTFWFLSDFLDTSDSVGAPGAAAVLQQSRRGSLGAERQLRRVAARWARQLRRCAAIRHSATTAAARRSKSKQRRGGAATVELQRRRGVATVAVSSPSYFPNFKARLSKFYTLGLTLKWLAYRQSEASHKLEGPRRSMITHRMSNR